MQWSSEQRPYAARRHSPQRRDHAPSREVSRCVCPRLTMLPDSLSHLHYLHHVFHHAPGATMTRSVLTQRRVLCFVGVQNGEEMSTK